MQGAGHGAEQALKAVGLFQNGSGHIEGHKNQINKSHISQSSSIYLCLELQKQRVYHGDDEEVAATSYYY